MRLEDFINQCDAIEDLSSDRAKELISNAHMQLSDDELNQLYYACPWTLMYSVTEDLI